MSNWKLLESFLARHVLPEEKMYRGETLIRMKDIRALFDELNKPDEKTKKTKSSDPTVQGDPNPNGGFVTCSYPVNARVWGRWTPSLNTAKILAGTDKKDTQHVGQAKGGMMMKKNYGGRVTFQPGNAGKDFDAQPSAMDRYDVIMVADVSGGAIEPGKNVNWPPDRKEGAPTIIVRKIVWSPSIGTAEERMARLDALLSGQQPAPHSRRPQPELPRQDPEAERIASVTKSPVANRQGANVGSPSAGYRTGRGPDREDKPDFKSRLAQHSANYSPQLQKSRPNDSSDSDDERTFKDDELPSSYGKSLRRKW